MKKLIFPLTFLLLFFFLSCKKEEELPVSEWSSNSKQPIIFYISGDAGFNTFSKTFAKELHTYGYDVFALNTKKYFWQPKTPLKTAVDIETFLKEILRSRSNKQVILIGYSYGADVAPFVYNRLDADFKKNISRLIIIGPSQVNDFEIHVEEYITGKKEYGYSVIAEINKLKNVPFTLVVSDYEQKHFPRNQITLSEYEYLHLKGNHHFSGNTKMLADSIVRYF